MQSADRRSMFGGTHWTLQGLSRQPQPATVNNHRLMAACQPLRWLVTPLDHRKQPRKSHGVSVLSVWTQDSMTCHEAVGCSLSVVKPCKIGANLQRNHDAEGVLSRMKKSHAVSSPDSQQGEAACGACSASPSQQAPTCQFMGRISRAWKILPVCLQLDKAAVRQQPAHVTQWVSGLHGHPAPAQPPASS